MVNVGSFCIDSTEVTSAQYEAFLESGPSLGLELSVCAFNTTYVPTGTWPSPVAAATNPVVDINWRKAYAFCKWAGKRMCGAIGGGSASFTGFAAANNQHYAACSASGQRTYPDGSSYMFGACNDRELDAGSTLPVGSLHACQGGFPDVYAERAVRVRRAASGSRWRDPDALLTGRARRLRALRADPALTGEPRGAVGGRLTCRAARRRDSRRRDAHLGRDARDAGARHWRRRGSVRARIRSDCRAPASVAQHEASCEQLVVASPPPNRCPRRCRRCLRRRLRTRRARARRGRRGTTGRWSRIKRTTEASARSKAAPRPRGTNSADSSSSVLGSAPNDGSSEHLLQKFGR